MDNTKTTRLGQILLEKGLVTKEQLTIAVNLQSQRRKDTHLDQQLPTSLGEILIEQGFITRLELKRGLSWQMLLRKMTLVMSFCAPMMAVFSPSAAAATVSSQRIEAESFSAMSGVETEPTSDVGGGENVGYLNDNDWMEYKNVTINAPVAGSYKITYRIASPGGGGRFVLKNAATGVVYDTVNVIDTGGWQTWKNIASVITLPGGNHSLTLSIVSRGNGFNLNWLDVQSVGSALPVTIQAEAYTSMSGVEAEPTTDIGGGTNVGYLNDNDWMSYSDQRIYIPKTGTYKVTYRIASPGGGGSLALKEAGSGVTYDTVLIKDTGGWQTWINVERTISLTAGTHSFLLTVIARGNGFNFNWFKIENITSTTTSSSAPSASSSSTPTTSSSSSKAPVFTPSSSSAAALSSSSISSKAASSTISISSSSSSKAAVSSSSSSISSSAASSAASVVGPVNLNWTRPIARENGNILDITELGGYELRYRKVAENAYTYVTINDAWTNTYNFAWLEGTYVFQIAAFDNSGLYSNFINLDPK